MGSTPIGDSIRNMGKLTLEQRKSLEKRFHVAYYIGYKGRPYTDFMDLLELEKLHEVKFFKTSSYENESACRDFVTFCSKIIFHKTVKDKLERPNFISILCDGSTDSAVVEKECIFILFVDPDTFSPTISFFSLRNVPSQDAKGVYCAITKAFSDEGMEYLLQRTVFLASDGASVNTGLKNGLISLIRKETPWVGFVWCLARRLELALKDSLKEWMEPITVCLQNLYYLYEKSSKKLRELKNLHTILKGVYEFDQVKPHRASGTRWIAHKLIALENMLDKFGLYMQHFENIIADTQKKTDKATLEGKRRPLEKAEITLVGALLLDLLEPARGLSLNTQEERVNIIKIVDSIGSTRKRYERLLNKVLKDPNTVLELPRIKSVLSKVTSEQSINDVLHHRYQGITLKYFPQAKQKVVSVWPLKF